MSKRIPILHTLPTVASAVLLLSAICLGQQPAQPATHPAPAQSEGPAPLRVMVGKSVLINTTERIKRVSVTDSAIADPLVVAPTQILIHGRAPGEVSLLIWDELERSRSFDLRVDVDVSATLIPGSLYHVSKLDWAGSPQMSAAAFSRAAKVHAGDVASQQAVLASLEKLDAAYRNVGYMDVIVNAEPKLDVAKHEVAFTLNVIPGPQYKLRNLHVNGLSAAQRSDFDSNWKLHSGDLYNAGYVATFLTNNTVIRSLSNYSASFRVKEDPEAAMLDLDITFAKSLGK